MESFSDVSIGSQFSSHCVSFVFIFKAELTLYVKKCVCVCVKLNNWKLEINYTENSL